MNIYFIKKIKIDSIYNNIKKKKIPRNKFNTSARLVFWKPQNIVERNFFKWKDILCCWTLKLEIAKMAILLKLVYRINAIPVKSSAVFFAEIDKLILKFKRPRMFKTLKENTKLVLRLTDLKIYYRAIVIKTVQYSPRE